MHSKAIANPSRSKSAEGECAPEPGNIVSFSVQQRETADYVCDMVLELRNAVLACQLSELAEVLKQAYYKAYAISNPIAVLPTEIRHIRLLEKASEESEKSVAEAYRSDARDR